MGATEDAEAAFLADPLAPAGPALRRLLIGLRGRPAAGKHVLVTIEPHRLWGLGLLSGRPGGGVRLLDGPRFTDRAEAERHVFRLRLAAAAAADDGREAAS